MIVVNIAHFEVIEQTQIRLQTDRQMNRRMGGQGETNMLQLCCAGGMISS